MILNFVRKTRIFVTVIATVIVTVKEIRTFLTVNETVKEIGTFMTMNETVKIGTFVILLM